MNICSHVYEKMFHRKAPVWLRRSGPITLVWRVFRKWLNVSVIPFIPFNVVRIWLYRLIGFRIGRNVFIGMQCYLDDMHPDRISIEDDVVVSYRVTFACHGPRSDNHRLILHKGCYIGCNATLLGGLPSGDIEIGAYASVGSCSLVNRSVAPLTTVAGIPARVIRKNRMPWGSDDHKYETIVRELGLPKGPPDE